MNYHLFALLLFGLLICSVGAHATTYINETFEGGSMPAGWTTGGFTVVGGSRISGTYSLNSTNADNNYVYKNSTNAPNENTTTVLESLVRITSTANTDHFFGFSDANDGNGCCSGNGGSKDLYFVYSGSGTNIQYAGDGVGNPTVLYTATAGTIYLTMITAYPQNGTVFFEVYNSSRTLLASSGSKTYNTSNINLSRFYARVGAAVANALYYDNVTLYTFLVQLQNLTASVADVRTGTTVTGFNWSYTTTNASDPGPFSGKCTGTSCSITNYSGTINISFTNISNGQYFTTANNSIVYNLTRNTVTGYSYSNSLNVTSIFNLVDLTSKTFCLTTTSDRGTISGCSGDSTTLRLYGMEGTTTFTVYNISNGTFYNLTGSIPNLNGSMYNYTNGTYQSLLNLSAYRLFLNTSINAFNASNGAAVNTTTTGSLLIPANNGSNTIMVNVSGNFTRTQTCTMNSVLTTGYCNVTGIYDTEFTIGAENPGGNSVLNFTVNVINSTLGSTLYNTNTTNGSIIFALLQGYYYNFSMNATGYALTSVINLSNNATQLYNFTLLSQNSFELYFRNETSDSILNNVNITVQVIGDSLAQNYTTGNGSLFVLLLTPEDYTIRYWYDSAVPRDYYTTLTPQSYQNLTLYIVDAGISQIYLPIIYNQFTRPIGDATVQLLRYFIGSNSYKVVEMAKTDTNGQAVLRVVPNIINYKLLITSGNTSFTTDPTKFTASTNGYTVSDAQNVLTSIVGMPNVQKSLSFNNATNTYIFTWTDTNNLVTSGCLYVDKYNNTGITRVKNTCEDGATGSIIYTITDTGNNTRYVASATIETNTEFSTYNFGPLTVEMGTATAAQIFGLTGFIIMSVLLVTVGFIANDHGNDSLIFVSLAGMLLIGVVGIVAYAWEAYVGIIILGLILVYKMNR